MINISSKNKKVLVFSDVHQEIDKIDRIIKSEAADINVCLGDWFDSHFATTQEDVRKTVFYYKFFIKKENSVNLYGNHDLHYFFGNPFLQCSGYERETDELVAECICQDSKIDRLGMNHWACVIDGRLASHAGLHPSLIPPGCKTNQDIFDWIDSEVPKAAECLITQRQHPFFQAGKARGGRANFGGLTWLDFSREFEPIDGLKQICGHTYRRSGKIEGYFNQDPLTSDNICIDTNLAQYLVFENEKITIKNYCDL